MSLFKRIAVTSISRLPSEIIRHMSGYLGVTDLTALVSTSQAIRT